MIDFIIPTYDRTVLLHSMLASLVAQYDDRWTATVVVDDIENNKARDIISKFDTNKISLIFTGQRHNDWGHTPREIGKQASVADYIIMTGDDNYYCPTTVADIHGAMESRPGMIYWDMVHSHYDYHFFSCTPFISQIDMGAFATRRDLAQQIKLGKAFAADGQFVMNFLDRFPNEETIKIPKVLFVHN